MGRPWRIEYEGALYHVLSRGNERRNIFAHDQDRSRFLGATGEMARRFQIEIFAYVLMANHYHLLLRTLRANLSQAMQWLGVTYTRRFNLEHSRSGHLFQGRFQSMLVQDDAYLLELSCYIHRNPLRAKAIERLVDYPWSSYRAYAYGKSTPEWLSMELILGQMPGSDPHRAYREKVQEYSEEEASLWEDFHHGLVLGSREFLEKIRLKYLPETPHKEIPQQKRVAAEIDPRAMLEAASQILNCDVQSMRKTSRISRSHQEDRDLLVFWIWNTGRYTNQRIADLFGLTYSSVSHIVRLARLRMKQDRRFREKLESIYSQFKM